jgi:5-bromo-4-chloroindolyl phosphate hydrolysis protein
MSDLAGGSAPMSILSKDTLVPVGLVVAILGCVFWLGTTIQRLNTIEDGFVRIYELERRVTIIENRQGITETQFSQIDANFNELKEDIKAIQKALKITP